MRNKILLLATSAALLATGAAHALTVTSNFTVSAVVGKNCLVSATNLDFGTYTGVAAANVDSTVSVRCTFGTPYTVRLSAGTGTYGTRLLMSGGNSLEYNLFTDAARTIVFGDNSPGTGQIAGNGAGLAPAAAVNVSVYGRLFDNAVNQNAPAGNYSATITATVEY